MQYNRKAALEEDHTPHYGNRTHYGMTCIVIASGAVEGLQPLLTNLQAETQTAEQQAWSGLL
jgi:hypothetical protein